MTEIKRNCVNADAREAIAARNDPFATIILLMVEGWAVNYNRYTGEEGEANVDEREGFLAVAEGNEAHAAVLDLMGYWGNDMASVAEQDFGLRIVNEAGAPLMDYNTDNPVKLGDRVHVEQVETGVEAYFTRRGWAWPPESDTDVEVR